MTRSLPRAGLNRRRFVQHSSAAGVAWSVAARAASSASAAEVESEVVAACPWQNTPNRPWLGAHVWANPMQDWQVAGQQAQCIKAAPNRNVQRLTHDLSEKNEPFEIRVRIARTDLSKLAGKGSAGFTLGIQGSVPDHRSRLVSNNGIRAGLAMDGALVLQVTGRDTAGVSPPQAPLKGLALVELVLTGQRGQGPNETRLTLRAVNPANGKVLAEVRRTAPSARLAGNISLTANYGGTRKGQATFGVGAFAFQQWTFAGARVSHHPEREFGPIFFSQYTLQRNTLKLTAQLPPMGTNDSDVVALEAHRDGRWRQVAEAKIHAQARTAAFRIDDWDGSEDTKVRVAYAWQPNSGSSEPTKSYWEGRIRKDPAQQDEVVVADISCNIHAAFPNAEYTERLRRRDPDILAFTGDQFYESTGGFGVVRSPLEPAIVDYLRKWLFHGWTWRELTRDRPSVAMPDDHDVYQGNIWGEGGAARQTTQEAGGYTMAPQWVNVVHRTQTSHHPDPFDPREAKQGISVYYGAWTYGGISFAILADRMFKTGPEGVAPKTTGRADHVTDPAFDPQTADVPSAQLLGERQMKFLRHWVEDWKDAEMKAVLSQTVFTSIATTHGRNRQRLIADYDTNAWPQTARNEAVALIRKAGAIHLAGDQHLPAVVRYGIEKHDDAVVAFAGPAVNVGYPRWWEPVDEAGKPIADVLGTFSDAFGHPVTMLAVHNPPARPQAKAPLELMQEKGSGFGLARFIKSKRKVVLECYPYNEHPANPDAKQFSGWPVEVDLSKPQLGAAVGTLPPVHWAGAKPPLVKVFCTPNADAGEQLVYCVRPTHSPYAPLMYFEGAHRVEVSSERDVTSASSDRT